MSELVLRRRSPDEMHNVQFVGQAGTYASARDRGKRGEAVPIHSYKVPLNDVLFLA